MIMNYYTNIKIDSFKYIRRAIYMIIIDNVAIRSLFLFNCLIKIKFVFYKILKNEGGLNENF